MYYLIAAAVVILADRVTKLAVTKTMNPGDSWPIIEGFFHLTYVKNPGAAFGILADKTIFFVGITFLILVGVIYFAYQLKGRVIESITLGMITGGAVGNLVDRLKTGLVIDFVDFKGIWPYIFNVADMTIVIGVILLSWRVLSDREAVDI